MIGWRLPVGEMVEAIPAAAAELQRESMLPAARAIMTTDRYPKLRRASAAGGSIVGTAKGAGMIEPDMALRSLLALPGGAAHREWRVLSRPPCSPSC